MYGARGRWFAYREKAVRTEVKKMVLRAVQKLREAMSVASIDVYVIVYPFMYLSANISFHPSADKLIYLLIHPLNLPSNHTSLHPFIRPSTQAPIHLCICPSIHLPTYLSTYLSIYLPSNPFLYIKKYKKNITYIGIQKNKTCKKR